MLRCTNMYNYIQECAVVLFVLQISLNRQPPLLRPWLSQSQLFISLRVMSGVITQLLKFSFTRGLLKFLG